MVETARAGVVMASKGLRIKRMNEQEKLENHKRSSSWAIADEATTKLFASDVGEFHLLQHHWPQLLLQRQFVAQQEFFQLDGPNGESKKRKREDVNDAPSEPYTADMHVRRKAQQQEHDTATIAPDDNTAAEATAAEH